MSSSRLGTAIPTAEHMSRVSYAIRRVVAEARHVEASGMRVRYLNTGDPVAAGFQTPPHMVAAVERALRDGDNGYAPSAGILSAREAVADEYTSRGWPITPDRVLLTSGSSEGIDFALTTLVDPGDEILVPLPTYPLYTAVIAKINGRPVYYRMNPQRGWLPDIDEVRSLITPRTRAVILNDPNNPTGAVYPRAFVRDLLNLVDHHGLVLLADEIYQDVAYDGPIAPIGSFDPDAPVLSLAGLSKGYLAPGWRTGWIAAGGGDRLKDVLAGLNRLAEGRLCTTTPMQHAVAAALTGDRSHQATFRAALRERAELTYARVSAIPGMSCVLPRAAFYAMPRVELPPGKTDVDYVMELLHATGVLVVYGSGFGMAPEDGYFRVVFLTSPAELGEIFDAIADFTRAFLAH